MCESFRIHLVEGIEANTKRIADLLENDLMLVTPLARAIGYDKASEISRLADTHELTLKEAALKLGFVSEDEFRTIVDPAKMINPYTANNN